MYLLCGCCRFIEIHIRIISRTSSFFFCHCCVNLNFQDYNRRPWDAQTLPDHYRCSISFWTVHCCSCACDCLYLPLQRYVNFLGLCVDFISLCFSFLCTSYIYNYKLFYNLHEKCCEVNLTTTNLKIKYPCYFFCFLLYTMSSNHLCILQFILS